MISANGRWVVFTSGATFLVPGDSTNYDVFLHDLQTGTTELVSHAFGGGFANNNSYHPTISDDGQRIAFVSDASNLLPLGIDTNGSPTSSSSIGDRARPSACRCAPTGRRSHWP